MPGLSSCVGECDKFWIKFIASLVSTFKFGFMTKKKLHPEVKLHRHGIYCTISLTRSLTAKRGRCVEIVILNAMCLWPC